MGIWILLIDGLPGSGKSTLADGLADYFGLKHFDRGMMFRAVTSIMMETGRDPAEIAMGLKAEDLKRSHLRDPELEAIMARDVSPVALVRAALDEKLREWVRVNKGGVVNGRTTANLFPEAQVKIHLVASEKVRASRRLAEQLVGDNGVDHNQVARALVARTELDATRKIDPYQGKHPEAEEIDTTDLNTNQVFERAKVICQLAGLINICGRPSRVPRQDSVTT